MAKDLAGVWLDLFGLGFGWDLFGFALSCVFGCGGCGGCVVVAVGCWQQCDGFDCVDEL